MDPTQSWHYGSDVKTMEHTDLNTLDLKESFISTTVIENSKTKMVGKRLKTKKFTNESPKKITEIH